MAQNEENNYHETLKADIEKIALRKISVKRDFEYLSAHIMDRTGAYLSPMTLRRFWGELAGGKYNVQPRRYTLDALARYTGHANYEQYIKSHNGKTDSSFINSDYLISNTLRKGSLLHIAWEPGHYIIAEYLGCEMFSITESHKSKLSCGDTFQADTITQGEPLYLNRLIHDGGAPCRYVCGQKMGIRFRLLATNTTKVQEETVESKTRQAEKR